MLGNELYQVVFFELMNFRNKISLIVELPSTAFAIYNTFCIGEGIFVKQTAGHSKCFNHSLWKNYNGNANLLPPE